MPKKYRPTLAKLSAYTKARNCTDLQQCKYGIDDLKYFFDFYESNKLRIPNEAYIRFAKLKKKEDKLREKKK
jgi:hypothetical protein